MFNARMLTSLEKTGTTPYPLNKKQSWLNMSTKRKITFNDTVQIPKIATGTVTFEMAHVKLDQKRLNKIEKLFNETLKKVANVLK